MPTFQDPGDPRRARRARYLARRNAELRRLAKQLYPYPRPLDAYTLEPLPAPEFVGYVRSFVPNVAETHPLYSPLTELLKWVDRRWIDTDKSFPVSKKRRRRARRRKAVQTLRTVSAETLRPGHRNSLPARLHFLLEPAPAWLDADGLPLSEDALAQPRQRHYRVANRDWYRLRVRRLIRTHRAVPSDATRQRQSLQDRIESNGQYELLYRHIWGSWRCWYEGEPLASRRSRDRAQEALDDLNVRPLRLRW
ncbi:MAG: hypothetical protein AAFQ43_03675 [Bacteroidota bacterium]